VYAYCEATVSDCSGQEATIRILGKAGKSSPNSKVSLHAIVIDKQKNESKRSIDLLVRTPVETRTIPELPRMLRCDDGSYHGTFVLVVGDNFACRPDVTQRSSDEVAPDFEIRRSDGSLYPEATFLRNDGSTVLVSLVARSPKEVLWLHLGNKKRQLSLQFKE
jgi:hypothetical protein